MIHSNIRDAVLGGRHQRYLKMLDDFFNRLHGWTGVKFVFFMEKSRGVDLDQLEELHRNSPKMLNHCEMNRYETSTYLRYPMGISVLDIARKYGKLLVVHNLSKAIVEFATKKRCVVAILARDSDFYICDLGNVEYWSCGIGELLFNVKQVMLFDQKQLLKHFGLTMYQLQIMMTVVQVIHNKKAQNYIVGDLKHHPELAHGPFNRQIISSVAETIKAEIPAHGKELNFNGIAQRFFGKDEWKFRNDIKYTYLKYFGCNQADYGADDDDKLIPKHVYRDRALYAMWKGYVISPQIQFLKLRGNNGEKPFLELYRSVTVRAAAVLLKTKKQGSQAQSLKLVSWKASPEIQEIGIRSPPCMY